VVAQMQLLMTGDLSAGQAWSTLVEGTGTFREHLDYLDDKGHVLPGDSTVVAAAMGAVISMLGYSILTAGSHGPGIGDDEIVDTLTSLLLHGLAGPTAPA
jgi:hypothetical protein